MAGTTVDARALVQLGHMGLQRVACPIGFLLRPKPDYIRNEADGPRFLDATQCLLTQKQIQPKAGSMERGMLESMGPVLYRVTMLGLIS